MYRIWSMIRWVKREMINLRPINLSIWACTVALVLLITLNGNRLTYVVAVDLCPCCCMHVMRSSADHVFMAISLMLTLGYMCACVCDHCFIPATAAIVSQLEVWRM